IGQPRRLFAQVQRLAAVDLWRADPGPLGELEAPRPLRPRPLGEAPGAGLVGLLVAGLEQAGQGGVGRARQQSPVAQERIRLVEGSEGAIGGEPAEMLSPLLKFRERRHAFLYSRPVVNAAILTIGNELVSGDVANTNGSW